MINNKQVVISFKKWEVILIGLLIFITLISPLIFKLPAISNLIALDGATANIGSSIGGITAPFIGLLGAFLVYKTIEAQIQTNKIQMDLINQELSYNYITNLSKEVIESFNSLKFYNRKDKKTLEGIESIKGLDLAFAELGFLYKNNPNQKASIANLESKSMKFLMEFSSKLNNLYLISLIIQESGKKGLPAPIMVIKSSIIASFVEQNIYYSFLHINEGDITNLTSEFKNQIYDIRARCIEILKMNGAPIEG